MRATFLTLAYAESCSVNKRVTFSCTFIPSWGKGASGWPYSVLLKGRSHSSPPHREVISISLARRGASRTAII